tara:strand:- start:26 stop:466 length:441 start_codon:yes stop_codon:yes gene_type:complete
MINNKQIKTINKMYDCFQFMNNITWTKHRDEIYKLELGYEKAHRNFCYGRNYGKFTANLSAKFFTCKHMFESINAYNKFINENESRGLYKVKDYLGIKKSIFHAQSFVENHQKQIQDFLQFQLSSDLFLDFDKLDYRDLVKMEEVA